MTAGTKHELRATIERFRNEAGPLDECAEAVLKRLTPTDDDDDRSHAVMPAFRAYPQTRWSVLIADCIHAERENRGDAVRFSQVILERADGAERAIHTLCGFVKLCGTAAGYDPVGEALGTLQEAISLHRRLAEKTIREHSRKTDAAARRSAAIGWLAESMHHVTGTPHVEAVRRLAEAVLDCGEITDDMVRKAVGPTARRRR